MEKEFSIICIFVIILFFVIGYFKNHKFRETDEIIEWNNMECLFFQKVNNGCRPYKLLDIYTPMDLMLIESLFLSEKIPYYCNFRHFMGLRPFVQIINYTNCNFFILEKDYPKAILIINDYMKTKDLDDYNKKDTVRNIVEIIVGFWLVYNPKKILGITIFRKENRIKKYIPKNYERIKKKQ